MSKTFEQLVQDYIDLRRGLGSRLSGQARELLDFGRYLDRLGHRGPITTELALEWAAQAPRSKDPDRTAQRLGTIRGFLRHRAGFDPATEIPPTQLLRCGIRRKPPHIYTEGEVRALLCACRELAPHGGLRPHTYTTLFCLLLCTGLRISEALRLHDRDVDLTSAVLHIRDGKFGKSRLVPVDASALEPLNRYVVRRNRLAPPSTFFFRTDYFGAVPYSAVRTAFDKLRDRLGWTSTGRSRRPRIQDMRHTFAVRRLIRWYRDGIHPDRRIAQLATYLGHVEVRDTYWYLTAVPELSSLAVERFGQFAQDGKRGAP